MSAARAPRLLGALCLALAAQPAFAAARDSTEVRGYLNDACIIADEPYFLPPAGGKDASDPLRAKFLPLIGLVIGKLTELYINHQIQASAGQIKAAAARKDTRYAVVKEMNLYRADFEPAPRLSINAKLGCMTVVAAHFTAQGSDCTAQYLPKTLARDSADLPQNEWKTSRTDDSIENQLRRANVCVDGKARAVYEARFEFSQDATAYRLKDAGYRIESLLTTEEKGASRAALYTLKISDPTATDQQETLSSAWVNLGTVSAGARSNGAAGASGPWLRVPPMSTEARRAYDDKTKVQQEVMGEIEALQRAITRNQRMLAGLDQRIAGASAEVAAGLREERTRIAVQIQVQGAELDARNAEYQDLPRSPLEFMPVTIELAVTESESEKKSQLALSEIVGNSGDLVASAVGNAASGLISKSLSPNELGHDPDAVDLAGALERARTRYFDALIAVKTSAASGTVSEPLQRQLAAAKREYNEAKRTLGLEQIE